MNEQLKQLAEQAGLAHFDDVEVNGEVQTIARFKMGAGCAELEKFAMLVRTTCQTILDFGILKIKMKSLGF